MVEVVNLDSDDDDTEIFFTDLLSTISRLAPSDISHLYTEVVEKLVMIKKRCPEVYLTSSGFKEDVAECKRGLTKANILQKLQQLGRTMAANYRSVGSPPSKRRKLDPPSPKPAELKPSSNTNKPKSDELRQQSIVLSLTDIQSQFQDDSAILRITSKLLNHLLLLDPADYQPELSFIEAHCSALHQLTCPLSTLVSLNSLLSSKEFGELPAVTIYPDEWFAAPYLFVEFPLPQFVMEQVFVRLLSQVLPEQRKRMITIFNKKFTSADNDTKKTILSRISQETLTNDKATLENKSYAASLLRCLGDCMEMCMKPKTRDRSRESTPTVYINLGETSELRVPGKIASKSSDKKAPSTSHDLDQNSNTSGEVIEDAIPETMESVVDQPTVPTEKSPNPEKEDSVTEISAENNDGPSNEEIVEDKVIEDEIIEESIPETMESVVDQPTVPTEKSPNLEKEDSVTKIPAENNDGPSNEEIIEDKVIEDEIIEDKVIECEVIEDEIIEDTIPETMDSVADQPTEPTQKSPNLEKEDSMAEIPAENNDGPSNEGSDKLTVEVPEATPKTLGSSVEVISDVTSKTTSRSPPKISENDNFNTDITVTISENADNEVAAAVDLSVSDNIVYLSSQNSIEFLGEESNECVITSVKAPNITYVEVDLKLKKDKTQELVTASDSNNLEMKAVEVETSSSGNKTAEISFIDEPETEKMDVLLSQFTDHQNPDPEPSTSSRGPAADPAVKSKRIAFTTLPSKPLLPGQESAGAVEIKNEPSDGLLEFGTFDDDYDSSSKAEVVDLSDDDSDKSVGEEEAESSAEEPEVDETSEEYTQKVSEIEKLSRKLEKISRRIRKIQEADIEEDEMGKWGNLYCQEKKLKDRHRRTLAKLEEIQGELNCHYHFNVKIKCGIPRLSQYIEDRLNTRQKFPDIEDVRRLLVRGLRECKMTMKDPKIKTLAKQIFLDAGSQIQTYRKTELRLDGGFHLMDEVDISKDPAKDDPELRRKLKQNRVEAKLKVKKIQSQFDSKQLQKELQDNDIFSDEKSDNEDDKSGSDNDDESEKDNEDESEKDNEEEEEEEEDEEDKDNSDSDDSIEDITDK